MPGTPPFHALTEISFKVDATVAWITQVLLKRRSLNTFLILEEKQKSARAWSGL